MNCVVASNSRSETSQRRLGSRTLCGQTRSLIAILILGFAQAEIAMGTDLPALATFSTDPIGHAPIPGPSPTAPDYVVESPSGIFQVIDSAMGLEDRPAVMYDSDGNYQALGWTVCAPITQVRCEAEWSLATFTNAYLHVGRDAFGDLVSRLEARKDGTIRPSFPSTLIVGYYQPDQPFRIQVTLSHTTTLYRVAVDNELDGFEDDDYFELPSISFQPVESIEFGYGWIPGTLLEFNTMAAIDNIRLDHYPTASVHRPFLRGDTNLNGALDVMDAIRILEATWIPGSEPLPCEDAADANDTGQIDGADAIYLLSHRFVPYSPPPPIPFPECGEDPSDDLLDCDNSPLCAPAQTDD